MHSCSPTTQNISIFSHHNLTHGTSFTLFAVNNVDGWCNFRDPVNNQTSVSLDTVYHTVGDVQVANRGASGVLSGLLVVNHGVLG